MRTVYAGLGVGPTRPFSVGVDHDDRLRLGCIMPSGVVRIQATCPWCYTSTPPRLVQSAPSVLMYMPQPADSGRAVSHHRSNDSNNSNWSTVPRPCSIRPSVSRRTSSRRKTDGPDDLTSSQNSSEKLSMNSLGSLRWDGLVPDSRRFPPTDKWKEPAIVAPGLSLASCPNKTINAFQYNLPGTELVTV